MSNFVLNLVDLYREIYPSNKFQIPEASERRTQNIYGRNLSYVNEKGVEVFLPVTLKNSTQSITIDCCTVAVVGSKQVVSTPVYERRGSVHEEFSVDDYRFIVKGVLIGKNRNFPDEEMVLLKELFESQDNLQIENAKTDLFLDKSRNVIMTAPSFPEMQGKDIRFQAFSFELISDSIDSLKII